MEENMLKRMLLLFVVFACAIGLAFGAKTRKRGDDEKPGTLTISNRDLCDPTTFNAAVGPGACVRDDNVSVNGSQKFAGFLAELGQEKSAGAWRINPDRVHTEEGVNLTLVNRGGETHTFTRVAEFGGGFIAALNAASGNPVPRQECAKVLAGGVLAPQPESPNNIFLEHGEIQAGPRIVEGEEAKFQCCIHPWMRITFNGRERRRD
jgi:hypothetical protein